MKETIEISIFSNLFLPPFSFILFAFYLNHQEVKKRKETKEISIFSTLLLPPFCFILFAFILSAKRSKEEEVKEFLIFFNPPSLLFPFLS